MLKTLYIENYALINKVHISLDAGFTVITGETGAGKSILLGALGLITGKRADSSSIGNTDRKCIVEGQFDIRNYALQHFFETHDLDFEEQTIIRRELLPSGKSRAFINDTPVTLQQLNVLGNALIDVHSQHTTLELFSKEFQYTILDTYAGCLEEVKDYQKTYSNYKKTLVAYENLKQKQTTLTSETDYNAYLYSELVNANIQENEYENIQEKHEQLQHHEEIATAIAEACQKLQQEDMGILDLLQDVKNKISRISEYSTIYKAIHERLDSVYIELEDIASSLEDYQSETETSPQALEQLDQRLSLLYELMQKHQTQSSEGLIMRQDELKAKVNSVDNLEEQIADAQAQIDKYKAQLLDQANKLREKRSKAIPSLTQLLEERVQDLHIPYARFVLKLNDRENFGANGLDDLDFLFSANKGQDVKPLVKAASGGELSRVMLALKGILTKHMQLPTLIFDEIDTGVSGNIATTMGNVLAEMSETMQLICITHLPQIAGQGRHHFRVLKEVDQDTHTEIIKLNNEERVQELVSMLGAKDASDAVVEHAKSLMNI